MEQRRLIAFRKPRTGKLITFETKKYFVTEDCQVWNGDLNRYLKQYEKKKYMCVDLFDDEGQKHSTIGVHLFMDK